MTETCPGGHLVASRLKPDSGFLAESHGLGRGAVVAKELIYQDNRFGVQVGHTHTDIHVHISVHICIYA